MMTKPLRIIFAGTPEFAAVVLDALLKSNHDICAVLTQPDRPAGRGRKITPSPVKILAESHNIPVYQPARLPKDGTSDKAMKTTLNTLAADIMVVVAYGLILPLWVLETPKLGCINVHASLLPRWRGAAPIQRALLSGDKETGVTIMQMDKGLDTGAMLAQKIIPIINDTTGTLHDRLAVLGAELLIETLALIQEKKVAPAIQDNSLATYADKILKSEAHLDWSLPAESLERCIRAFNPWPVAYTKLSDTTLRIWKSTLLSQQSDEKPGTITDVSKDGIDVATGNGMLRLTEIQVPGRRAMSSADFLNSNRDTLAPGSVFT